MDEIEVFLDAYGKLRQIGVLRRYPGTQRERVTYEHDAGWLDLPDAFHFDPGMPRTPGVITPP